MEFRELDFNPKTTKSTVEEETLRHIEQPIEEIKGKEKELLRISEERRNENVANSENKLSASFDAAVEANNVVAGYEYLNHISSIGFDEDEDFIEGFSKEQSESIVDALGFLPEDREPLSEAVSADHLESMIELFAKQRERRENISKNLTTAEMVGSSFAGGLLDATTVVGGGIYAAGKSAIKAGQAISLSQKYMGATGIAVEASLGYAYSQTHPEFDVVGNTLNIGLPLMFNTAGLRSITKGADEAIARTNHLKDIKKIEADNLVKKKEAEFQAKLEASGDKYKKKYQEEKKIATAQEKKQKLRENIEAETKRLDRIEEQIKQSKGTQKPTYELNSRKKSAENRVKFYQIQEAIAKQADETKKLAESNPKLNNASKSADEQVEIHGNIKEDIDAHFKFAKTEIEKSYKHLYKEAEKGNKAAIRILHTLEDMVEGVKRVDAKLGEKLNVAKRKSLDEPSIKMKINKDGSATLVAKNGNKVGKKIPIAVVSSLGLVSAANASEGESSISYAGAFILAALSGGLAISALTKYGTMGSILKTTTGNLRSTFATGVSQVRGKGMSKAVDEIIENTKLEVWGAYQALMKSGNSTAMGLAKDLLYDFTNTLSKSAEKIKLELMQSSESKLFKEVDKHLATYLQEKGINKLNFTQRIKAGLQFQREVYETMGGKISNSPAVNSMAKANRALMDSLDDTYKALGGVGSNIKRQADYVTRIWKIGSIQQVIRDTDNAGRAVIKDALIKAIMKKQTKEHADLATATAEHLLNYFMKASSGVKRGGDEEIGDLITYLRDNYVTKEGMDVDIEAINKIFSKQKDAIGRYQYRIDMDLDELDGLVIKQNGIDETLDKGRFVETNAEVVMQKYINELTGHIALGKKGYLSEKELDNMIAKVAETNPKEAEVLSKVKDSILGRQLIADPDSTANWIANNVRNMALTSIMPLIVLSTSPELINVVGRGLASNAGRKQLFNEVKNVFKKFDKDDNFINFMSKSTNIGNNRSAHNIEIRTVEGLENASMGTDVVSKTTAAARDLAVNASGLLIITDLTERVSAAMMYELLGKIVNGTKTISSKRMAQYGISEDTISLLKEHMKIGDNGNLKNINFDNLSDEAAEALSGTIASMVNTQVQRTSLAGTPMVYLDNPLGKTLGAAMGFAANAYTNLGLRSFYNRDINAALDNAMWYMGAYIGTVAKDKIRGTEHTDEELHKRSLMSLPITSPIGVYQSLVGSGLSSSTSKSITDATVPKY